MLRHLGVDKLPETTLISLARGEAGLESAGEFADLTSGQCSATLKTITVQRIGVSAIKPGKRATSVNRFDVEALFKSSCSERDNFLSRAFALFAEEPVRLWAEMDSSPYGYLGRPTIFPKVEPGYTVLDFALERKADRRCFVAEMKCELAYCDYGYMTLSSVDQIERHRTDQLREGKKSFARFLESATSPESFSCKITTRGNRRIERQIFGAILVWGRVGPGGREMAMNSFGFSDVLSVESIVNDLLQSNNAPYREFLQQRQSWYEELFTSLLGGKPLMESSAPSA